MTDTVTKPIELMVDVKQAYSYLRTRDLKPIRGKRQNQLDAIHVHAKKILCMGVFEKTAARLLRQRWPEADAELILTGVHTVYETMFDKFGSDSLLDKMDRELLEAEEPSEFLASEFENQPDYEQGWLVDDMVPDDDAILNQGDGGAGKTTTMLQLAVAVATGRDWLGMSTGVIPKRVLFFSCEERSQKIRMRIKPILDGASSPYDGEVTWADLTKLKIVALADRDAMIAVKDTAGRIIATEMYRYFAKKIEEHKPALVIVDSLYDTYAGDENTRAQVRQFVGMLRRFTGKFGCALIMLGHPSLTGMASGSGTSGSTGWRNSFRGMLYTTIEQKKDEAKGKIQIHKIEVMKGNYGAPGEAIRVIWQDGIFIPLEEDDAAVAKNAATIKTTFLEMLSLYVAEDRAVTAAPSASNFAPKAFSRDKRAAEFTTDEFRDAMDSLFADSAIALRGYRRKNRTLGERLEPTGVPIITPEKVDDATWDDM